MSTIFRKQKCTSVYHCIYTHSSGGKVEGGEGGGGATLILRPNGVVLLILGQFFRAAISLGPSFTHFYIFGWVSFDPILSFLSRF